MAGGGSDFPRGWTLTANGNSPSLTIAAVTDVAHVLTQIDASARDTQNTGPFANNTQLVINGTPIGDFNLEDWSPNPPAVTWSAKDTFSWSGEWNFGPGAAIAFTFFSPVSFAILTVQGYDI